MRYLFLPRFRGSRRGLAFTLIELLVVIAIVAILAGLVISISGLAQKKAALARAKAEVAAIGSACESYKADNGGYPHQPLAVSGSIPATGPVPSDLLQPAGDQADGNSSPGNSKYEQASLELYQALTGDLTSSGTGGGTKNYLADMKPDSFGRNNPSAPVSPSNTVQSINDPFGNCYGYSTAYATAILSGSTSKVGYNLTYDLWSTGGTTAPPYTQTTGANAAGAPGDPSLQWETNWR
jgi:prepilin-type N-terminal cleavage/methylation domain-containing protein